MSPTLAYWLGVATPFVGLVVVIAARLAVTDTVQGWYGCHACNAGVTGPAMPRVLPFARRLSRRRAENGHWRFWREEAANGSKSAIALAHWHGPLPGEEAA